MIAGLLPELYGADDRLEDFPWPTRLGPGIAVSTPLGVVHSSLNFGTVTLDSRRPDRTMWHRRTSIRVGVWSRELVRAVVVAVPIRLWYRQQPGEGRWAIVWRMAFPAERPVGWLAFTLDSLDPHVKAVPFTGEREFGVAWETSLDDPTPMSLALITGCSEPEDLTGSAFADSEVLCSDAGPRIADNLDGLVLPLPASGRTERDGYDVDITWMQPFADEEGCWNSADSVSPDPGAIRQAFAPARSPHPPNGRR